LAKSPAIQTHLTHRFHLASDFLGRKLNAYGVSRLLVEEFNVSRHGRLI